MSLIENQSKCKIKLIQVGIVDICDDAIEKVVEIAKTLLTSINVMQCSDAKMSRTFFFIFLSMVVDCSKDIGGMVCLFSHNFEMC